MGGFGGGGQIEIDIGLGKIVLMRVDGIGNVDYELGGEAQVLKTLTDGGTKKAIIENDKIGLEGFEIAGELFDDG